MFGPGPDFAATGQQGQQGQPGSLEAIANLKSAAAQQARMNQVVPLLAGIGSNVNVAGGENVDLGASIAGAAPGVIGNVLQRGALGAAGGAAAGAFAGGIGAIPGAIGGGAAGVISGLATTISELREEEKQSTLIQKVSFRASKSNIKAIIDAVNKNLISPMDAISLYNRELAKIDRVERNLKMLSEREWLSKAKDELIMVQQFNDFERQRTALMLEQALLRPNPNAPLMSLASDFLESEVSNNG